MLIINPASYFHMHHPVAKMKRARRRRSRSSSLEDDAASSEDDGMHRQKRSRMDGSASDVAKVINAFEEDNDEFPDFASETDGMFTLFKHKTWPQCLSRLGFHSTQSQS
jgi:hypothetical protein